ncbi:MAG: ATP/GTP-binding protein [Myxococcota bacterium]|nr:GTPase domain-containing protein [Myxococcota bacterium]
MQFNTGQREIVLKVVYYGPPLSGKTSNLQALHRALKPDACGRLTTLDTANDRTLFFDVLPVTMNTRSGYRLKLKLFTVPGQVIHAATRRLVLSGADAVVFVADSQRSESQNNNEFWRGMRRFLTENGLDADSIPVVIQFNKRDLPSARSIDELTEVARKGREPVYPAVAVRGEGVLDTLYGLIELLFVDLNKRYHFVDRFQITAQEMLGAIFGDFKGAPSLSQRADIASKAAARSPRGTRP